MSKPGGESTAFQGQLFCGEARSKSWSPLGSGQVVVAIRQNSRGQWWILAGKGRERVWEGRIDGSLKHRVRDTFVQWQQSEPNGPVETYGFRLKNAAAAKQFSDTISSVLSRVPTSQTNPETQVVQQVDLKVLLPGKELTTLAAPKNATMSQVLKVICQQRKLDPSHHAIALPPDSPQGPSTICQGAMSVGALNSSEIHVVKRGVAVGGAAEEHTDGTVNGTNEQTILLQVELPKGERTVVRVSPSLPLPEVLQYICEKRNLLRSTHRFDLPATEESLVDKTLEQLKINSIRVIEKLGSGIGTPPSQKRKKSVKGRDKASSSESPKGRRLAPPPPPPPQRRRTQPDMMKELAAEVFSRNRAQHLPTQEGDGETGGGVNQGEPLVNGGQRGSEDVDGTREGDSSGTDSGAHTPTSVTTETRRLSKRSRDHVARRELKPRSIPAPPPPNASGDPPGGIPASVVAESLPGVRKAPPPEINGTPLPGARGAPPPVAEKPKKKTESVSSDEPDTIPSPVEAMQVQLPPHVPSGSKSSSIPHDPEIKRNSEISREALDFLVSEADVLVAGEQRAGVGVLGRVHEHTQRPEMGSVVEGLKKQVASQGRVLSVKKISQRGSDRVGLTASLNHTPQGRTHPRVGLTGSLSVVPSALQRGEEQVDGDAKPLSKLRPRDTTSLKRRPRGPAPPPPKGIAPPPSKDAGSLKARESGGTRPTRVAPVRKAPARPAPHRPSVKGKDRSADDSPLLTSVTSSSPPGTTSQSAGSSPLSSRRNTASSQSADSSPPTPRKNTASPESADSSPPTPRRNTASPQSNGSSPPTPRKNTASPESADSSPPTPRRNTALTQSAGSFPSRSPRRRNTVTAVVNEKKDGGKVLIVTPSPISRRKFSHQLVFNLPPPPPLDFGEEEETGRGRGGTEVGAAKVKVHKEVKQEVGVAVKGAEVNQEDMSLKPSESDEGIVADSKSSEQLGGQEIGGDTTPPERTETAKPEVIDPVAVEPPPSLTSTPMTSPLSPAELSILSNEYTNLDDLSSSADDMTADFSSEDNLEPRELTEGGGTETGGTKERERKEEVESNASSEGGFNVTETSKSSSSDSDSACGYDFTDASVLHESDLSLPPPLPESPDHPPDLVLNANTNNSNNSSLEKTEVCEEAVDLLPPSEFMMPLKPSFEAQSSEEEGGGGIVLVSMVTHHEEVPMIPVGASDLTTEEEEEEEKEEEKRRLLRELAKVKQPDIPAPKLKGPPSIGTRLSELDTMVSSLQMMITETTGSPPGMSSPPPRPTQPIGNDTPPRPTHPINGIPPPPRPPPPPGMDPRPPPPPGMERTKEFPQSKLTIPAKPLPPHTGPRLESSPPRPAPDGDAVQSELTARLRERQRQLQSQASAETAPTYSGPDSIPQSSPGSMPQSSPGSMPYSSPGFMPQSNPGSIPYPAPPLVQHNPLHSLTHTFPPTSSVAGGNDPVQMQLQFLQQQVFHQQMMQLQQQVQQLHHMALQQNVPLPSNPMMPPSYLPQAMATPNPALLGLQHHQALPPHPSSLAQHQAMIGAYLPPTSQQIAPGIPPQAHLGHAQLQGQVAPLSSIPPPSGSGVDPVTLRPKDGTHWRRRHSSQKIRSTILGELENQFDDLMEEVRDADPTEVLSKPPEEDRDTGSSYTGMAAALAEALKQRRQHFTDKRMSSEHDDSHVTDWGSP